MTAQEEVDEFWEYIRRSDVIGTRKRVKRQFPTIDFDTHYSNNDHRNAWYETTAVGVTQYWDVAYYRRGIVTGGDANRWLKRAMANRWNIDPKKK